MYSDGLSVDRTTRRMPFVEIRFNSFTYLGTAIPSLRDYFLSAEIWQVLGCDPATTFLAAV